MSGRAAAVTAALAAAVTALSAGCSSTVQGTARPGTELKAASVEVIAPAAPQREWVDVTGQGVSLPRDTSIGAQYSPVPKPGAATTFTAVGGGSGGCTLGPAVRAGSREGFITAGHCAFGATGPQQLSGSDGKPVRDLGRADDAAFSRGFPNSSGYAQDSAIVWTAPGAGAALIAGTWPVAGTLTVDEVRALPVGTPICFAGAMTGGVACGPLLDARDPGGIHFGHAAEAGDSGAATFLVADGAAWLVGIMSSTDDDKPESTAALLAPALDRLGVEAITAR